MSSVVKAKVWASRDTVRLAQELLGCRLVALGEDGTERRLRITETEAYDGPEDRACHASKGRTARTEVMFGPAGHWYIYLCYGMHQMLNLVTGPVDWPAAVLIRGVEGITGPGRVTRAFGIGKPLNGVPAFVPDRLWLEARDQPVHLSDVLAGPRIGVEYAGPRWAGMPWRFRWMPRWSPPRARRG